MKTLKNKTEDVVKAEELEDTESARDEVESKLPAISIDRLEKVTGIIASHFNLSSGDYVVTSFKDSGSKATISLANPDFNLTVVIKDTEMFGI